MLKVLTIALLLIFACVHTLADVYMHNPRGSNDRLNEENTNRNNANRLFDSQNNAKGGYAAGEYTSNKDPFQAQPMYYFAGSKLYLEWTAQHACGPNGNTNCEIILQYMCDDGPTRTPGNSGTYNQQSTAKKYNNKAWGMTDGTSTGNAGEVNPPTTGRNEPDDYYTKCTTRERNKGLYIADRNLQGNAARFTRQNNNGQRHGNECPEERDYYPYWHPNPWKDIAILTSNISRCEYYQSESFNVNAKFECECATWKTTGCNSNCWKYNTETTCNADTQNSCTWVSKTHATIFQPDSSAEQQSKPDCGPAEWSRDNHLGNTMNGETARYVWTIPTPQQACGRSQCNSCVLRVRYNITTGDYHNLEDWQYNPPAGVTVPTNNYTRDYFFVDWRLNGARSIKMDNNNNFFANDPIVDMAVGDGLALALNTAQTGRTFQDRSYLFEIRPRPAEYASTNIYNVNVRGKRGNIVQVYPAVEYDFVPNKLSITKDDAIHFQWVGSNRNPAGNDGQGRAQTDRNNLLEFSDLAVNLPKAIEDYTMFDPKTQQTIIKYFATSTMAATAFQNTQLNQNGNNDPNLNESPPYFDGFQAMGNKLLKLKSGKYIYSCTRNNNFSNRSQKASIVIA